MGASSATSSLSQRKIDILFLVYFVVHIPTTIFFDCQSLFPDYYPQALKSIVVDYVAALQDPFVLANPPWFVVRPSNLRMGTPRFPLPSVPSTWHLLMAKRPSPLGTGPGDLRDLPPAAVLLLLGVGSDQGYVRHAGCPCPVVVTRQRSVDLMRSGHGVAMG